MNIHEKAGLFGRFGAAWTPTILILSPKGVERHRVEGYLPRDEFVVQLEMGLGRNSFMAKRFDDAERWYSKVASERANSTAAAEATYWRAVSQYSSSHDATPLREVVQELRAKFPDSIWAKKSLPWSGE